MASRACATIPMHVCKQASRALIVDALSAEGAAPGELMLIGTNTPRLTIAPYLRSSAQHRRMAATRPRYALLRGRASMLLR